MRNWAIGGLLLAGLSGCQDAGCPDGSSDYMGSCAYVCTGPTDPLCYGTGDASDAIATDADVTNARDTIDTNTTDADASNTDAVADVPSDRAIVAAINPAFDVRQVTTGSGSVKGFTPSTDARVALSLVTGIQGEDLEPLITTFPFATCGAAFTASVYGRGGICSVSRGGPETRNLFFIFQKAVGIYTIPRPGAPVQQTNASASYFHCVDGVPLETVHATDGAVTVRGPVGTGATVFDFDLLFGTERVTGSANLVVCPQSP